MRCPSSCPTAYRSAPRITSHEAAVCLRVWKLAPLTPALLNSPFVSTLSRAPSTPGSTRSFVWGKLSRVRTARLLRGTNLRSPFFVSCNCSCIFSRSTSTHLSESSSPRLHPVNAAKAIGARIHSGAACSTALSSAGGAAPHALRSHCTAAGTMEWVRNKRLYSLG